MRPNPKISNSETLSNRARQRELRIRLRPRVLPTSHVSHLYMLFSMSNDSRNRTITNRSLRLSYIPKRSLFISQPRHNGNSKPIIKEGSVDVWLFKSRNTIDTINTSGIIQCCILLSQKSTRTQQVHLDELLNTNLSIRTRTKRSHLR